MKRLRYKLRVKIISFLIVTCMISVVAISVGGIFLLLINNAYTDDGRELKNDIYCQYMSYNAPDIEAYYHAVREDDKTALVNNDYKNRFSEENSNIFFEVKDPDGVVLFANYTADEYTAMYQVEEWGYDAEDGKVLEYVLNMYVRVDLVAKDTIYRLNNITDFFVGLRYALIPLCFGALLVAIVLMCFMVSSVGHIYGVEGVRCNFIDKIPFDLYLAVITSLCVLAGIGIDDLFESGDLVFLPISYVAIVAFLLVILTLATRIKTKTLIKNNVLYYIFNGIGKVVSFSFRIMIRFFSNLHLYWKAALVFVIVSVVEFFIMIFFYGYAMYPIFWSLVRIIIAVAGAYILVCLQKLKKSGEELSDGNIGYKTDLKYLFGDMKKHGENLNNLGIGLSRAVEERIKSERTKSELIANVSHDIKTPLTSIVNYVDLLTQEDLDPDDAKIYLEVLSRQSARLKKLTEDLIEASKVSTGNIHVNLEETDLTVLVTQAVAEYEEKLSLKQLNLIMRLPESNPIIMADGRLFWRVLDNILNNICKYSLESTRVYLTVSATDTDVTVTTSNISKEPLNISGEELAERFVRGDSSRNTEGSGLGLSIAKSLVELQNGKFDVTVDGDLFKTSITMSLLKLD